MYTQNKVGGVEGEGQRGSGSGEDVLDPDSTSPKLSTLQFLPPLSLIPYTYHHPTRLSRLPIYCWSLSFGSCYSLAWNALPSPLHSPENQMSYQAHLLWGLLSRLQSRMATPSSALLVHCWSDGSFHKTCHLLINVLFLSHSPLAQSPLRKGALFPKHSGLHLESQGLLTRDKLTSGSMSNSRDVL